MGSAKIIKLRKPMGTQSTSFHTQAKVLIEFSLTVKAATLIFILGPQCLPVWLC